MSLSIHMSDDVEALRPSLSQQPTLIWVHDTMSRSCDLLIDRMLTAAASASGGALWHVEEIGSLEAAWVALDKVRRARQSPEAEEVLVVSCLDLPPAPKAGGIVNAWARAIHLPVVLVTYGRRWLPVGGSTSPLLSPSASSDEIGSVVDSVLLNNGLRIDAPPESFPGRPSWLG